MNILELQVTERYKKKLTKSLTSLTIIAKFLLFYFLFSLKDFCFDIRDRY